MEYKSEEAPDWAIALAGFLLAPAILFFVASAVGVATAVIGCLILLNLPFWIWGAITRKPPVIKFWNSGGSENGNE